MKFFTTEQVIESLSISRQTLARWCGNGMFPQPLRLGGRTLRWREDAIRAWLEKVEAAGVASPSFKASDWKPTGEEASDYEKLAASTDDELAASLTAMDTTE